jgi:hypothetical protein
MRVAEISKSALPATFHAYIHLTKRHIITLRSERQLGLLRFGVLLRYAILHNQLDEVC